MLGMLISTLFLLALGTAWINMHQSCMIWHKHHLWLQVIWKQFDLINLMWSYLCYKLCRSILEHIQNKFLSVCDTHCLCSLVDMVPCSYTHIHQMLYSLSENKTIPNECIWDTTFVVLAVTCTIFNHTRSAPTLIEECILLAKCFKFQYC